jgi:MFS family permease
MLFSLLSGQLITSLGWRKAYFVLSAIAFIVMIPAIFLFIKSPEEKGVLPYGAEEESAEEGAVPKEEWGLTRKEAFTKFAFWAAWATCLCYSIGSCANGYIVPFTTMELGQSVNYGARVGMFSSIGGILCSFILGRINDKFGSKAGMLWGAVTTVLGFVIVIMSIGNTDLVMLGSFVVGLGSSMYGVQCPILAKEVLGDKHFSSVWSIMMTANSLIGGGLYSSFALFYDIGGTYRGAFITGAILYVLALVVGSLSINSAKSYKPDSVK